MSLSSAIAAAARVRSFVPTGKSREQQRCVCSAGRPRSAQEKPRLTACHAANPPGAVSRRELQLLLSAAIVPVALPEHAGAIEKPTTVFVAGATGATGKQVVKALRAKGIKVIAGVRDVKKAEAAGFTRDSGIDVVIADVTKGPSVLATAMKGADAVICAIGGGAVTPFDKRAKTVDNQGTKNLADAAKLAGVGSFVYVSSLLTNAKALGQTSNPNYVVLQLFGGVLEEKLQAEKYLRASGLRWTIVRPGGLSDEAPEKVGNLIVRPEDNLLAMDGDPGREISRQTVAEVCVEALLQDSAANKVVEIVAARDAPKLPESKWFDV